MGRLSNDTVCLVVHRRMAVTLCGLEVRNAARVETPRSWEYRQVADPKAVLHGKCQRINDAMAREERVTAIRNGAEAVRARI